MKNRGAFAGLLLSIFVAMALFGFEVYINGRPETFDYCNNGDYPYSNWYYEYGDFAWNNIDWSRVFGKVSLYVGLSLLAPFFIFFASELRGREDGVYRSKWLKIIMLIALLPLVILLSGYVVHSQPFVVDYDTECDPVVANVASMFVLTLLVYLINMLSWAVVYVIKRVRR